MTVVERTTSGTWLLVLALGPLYNPIILCFGGGRSEIPIRAFICSHIQCCQGVTGHAALSSLVQDLSLAHTETQGTPGCWCGIGDIQAVRETLQPYSQANTCTWV